MISFDKVYKRYPNGREALTGVSLRIAAGEMVFLTGRSGAGKSSVLKLISLLERPTRGTVTVNGQNTGTLAARAVPAFRRGVGMVFQDHKLLMDRPVFDNVALPLVVTDTPLKEIDRRVRAALDQVGLLGKERLLPIELSIGEQQRVGIARAVIARPPVLIADEPTGNLDHALALEVIQRVQATRWDRPSTREIVLPGLTGSHLPIATARRYVNTLGGAATLVIGVSTYARLYVRDETPGPSTKAIPKMVLHGFRRHDGVLVALSPASVVPEYAPARLGRSSMTVESARRGALAVLFRLPDTWTRVRDDQVVLVASVNADGAVPECEDEGCLANDWIALDNLSFSRTGAHPISLLRSTWPGRTGATADDGAWLADVRRMMLEYQPYDPTRSPVLPSASVTDLRRDIVRAQHLAHAPETGRLLDCWGVEACQVLLPGVMAARAAATTRPPGYFPVLPIKAGPAEPYGMITGYGPLDATWVALDFNHDGDNVARLAHEVGHSIADLRHVAGCGSAALPDPSYPDPDGLLASWAFIPPTRAGQPGRTFGPADAYDVMTYCDLHDEARRMSLHSWNRAVSYTLEPINAKRRSVALAPVGPTLRVSAIAVPGGTHVAANQVLQITEP